MFLRSPQQCLLMLCLSVSVLHCNANYPNGLALVNGNATVQWVRLLTPAYRTFQFGFSQDTTLNSLLQSVPNADQLYTAIWGRAANNVTTFWLELYKKKKDDFPNVEMESVIVSYALFVCDKLSGQLPFCPSPCRKNVCGRDHVCVPVNAGLFVFDYTCNCSDGYSWNSDGRRCMFCGADSYWSLTWRSCVPLENTQVADDTTAPDLIAVRTKRAASWSAWTSWTLCTNPCGEGTQFRSRTCPKDTNERECEGNNIIAQVLSLFYYN